MNTYEKLDNLDNYILRIIEYGRERYQETLMIICDIYAAFFGKKSEYKKELRINNFSIKSIEKIVENIDHEIGKILYYDTNNEYEKIKSFNTTEWIGMNII